MAALTDDGAMYLRDRYLERFTDQELIAQVAHEEARLHGGAGGFPGTAAEIRAFLRDAAIELRYRNEQECRK